MKTYVFIILDIEITVPPYRKYVIAESEHANNEEAGRVVILLESTGLKVISVYPKDAQVFLKKR